ncbi:MAG: protein translocase subunit SecDF [Paludibacteraceae bacterium]|nr:protein translocase subunit SecDF [Paludibacteraceae bacterium]
MQNKGAIKLFAILLALVSLYQLSFTWVTNRVRSDAKEFAKGDRNLESRYMDSISNKGVYNFLWLKDFTYRETQDKELNLGLDLKGGMNVTLEVSVIDLIRSMTNNSKDKTFEAALVKAKELQKESSSDFVTLFGQAFKDIDPNAKLASIFSTRELKDRISFNTSNEDVLEIIRTETKDAIDNSFNIIRSRIDRFGVAQPNIQQLEIEGQILVELPGVIEPERVRKLLQGAAKLEFWETYDNQEVYGYLTKVNEFVAQKNSVKKVSENNIENVEVADSVASADSATDVATEDSVALAENENKGGLDSLMSEISKDTTSTSQDQNVEAWKEKNPLFAVLNPQVSQDGQLMQGAAVGFAHFKDTAKVNSYLNDVQARRLYPRELRFFWTVKPIDNAETFYQLVAVKATRSATGAALAGDVITNARSEFDNTSARAKVSMTMNGEGAKAWARITGDNIGKQIAVVLDNYVYSFPVVNQEISGGSSEISGNFTIQEAKDLANILKSGKMPAPAQILQEELVGPSLGKEAIRSGTISFVIAFVLVLLYMIFFYRSSGLVSDISLIANVFFIFGVLASFGAVLTLPGLAGIVLTLGMAVDANIIIFERIKEELRLGKGVRLAISDGYKNAYSAIIDANVTSLLTAIILGYFGKGPIYGFAVTLGIGILTSLFSAIFITRLIMTWWLDKNKEIKFSSSFSENLLKNVNLDFIGKRKTYYIISSAIILIGIGSLFVRGLSYGVDFKGGRSYIVRFDETVKTNEVAAALAKTFGSSPEVKTYGESNQVKITTAFLIDDDGKEVDAQIEELLYQGLKPMIKSDVDKETFLLNYRMSSHKVGPTVAADIKISAIWATLFSLIVIFLYIFIRFKNPRYGLGAVAALAHDSLIVIGIFSLFHGILPFSLEIDQAFIAAILTVIGYSINDTVIVFDRIREYRNLKMKGTREEVLNAALNSTLVRTLGTSMTTLVVLTAIFIFGGEVIRGFIFAMLVGILVGTYSSVCVATPILFDTEKVIDKQQQKIAEIQERRKMKKKDSSVEQEQE